MTQRDLLQALVLPLTRVEWRVLKAKFEKYQTTIQKNAALKTVAVQDLQSVSMLGPHIFKCLASKFSTKIVFNAFALQDTTK